jgi:chemotaxis family two-component system response regulator Rcp1
MSAIRLLLVEDNDSDVFFFREALRGATIEVELEVCSRGDIALERLTEHRHRKTLPDLLVIDLNLPRMTGLELLKRIQEDPVLSRLPSVVLSSSSAESDVAACYLNGARAYLVKPMDFERLTEMIITMVGFWSHVVRG